MGVPLPSADQVSPALRRDLFFGDLALLRRKVLVSEVAAGLCILAFLAMLVFDRYFQAWPLYWSLLLSPGIVGPARRDWKKMRATAAADPELASDDRFAAETRRVSTIRATNRTVRVLRLVGVGALAAVLGPMLVRTVRAEMHPAPPMVELVDVRLVNGPADVEGAITLAITGGRVSLIAPYAMYRSVDPQPSDFHAFEAQDKYAVGGTLDLSQPDPLEAARATWMRPIAVGASGDLIVFDVDPRLHPVTMGQVAAAVVDGVYLSRLKIAKRQK